MKLSPRLRWLLGAALALPITQSPTRAADAAGRSLNQMTGTVAGRVQNAITGQYLINARVTVQGSDLETFTDESGTYHLAAVPAGAAVLEVFFTGLDVQRVPLNVRPGETVLRDIDLSSGARYGKADLGVVELDAFVVATERETNNASIAVNEQRFAGNIKNVIAADALGDVMDGNVGEFLKFMPGVTAEYDRESGGSVASVAVRGLPTNLAVVSADGLQMANTGNPQGSSRVFQFTQVSINNIARLEVTKVPTPSSPADSMGGSIDMISKSSFERKNAQLRTSLSLSGCHRTMSLHRVPHTTDERVYKLQPSFTFDYTLPVNKDFGLVLTGQSQNRFIEMEWVPRGFNAAGTATGASFSKPYMNSFQLNSVPRTNARNSAGLKADWRATRNSVLSLTLERGRFTSDRSIASIGFTTGTNANPTTTSGVRMTFGPDFTDGATGRGGVTLMGAGAGVYQKLDTKAANLRWRIDDGNWRVTTGLGWSNSSGGYQDTAEGRFRNFAISMKVPVRVRLADINTDRPQVIRVFDNSEREVDFYDLENYQLTTAASTPRLIRDSLLNARLDVRRNLSILPFPVAAQAGVLQKNHVRDVRRDSFNLTYNGPDGNPNTPDSPALFRNKVYVNQEEDFGFRNMPWISSVSVWRAYQANPTLFSQTPAQVVAQELFRLNNSEYLEEDVTAGYVQTEFTLFHNRLRVLTGVRYEQTLTLGEGVRNDPSAVYLRNADGSFAHTATGARIRRSEAGAAGSLQELAVTRQERGASARRLIDGYYPSAHLTYHVRENLLARLAYAKTYGRPDFANIIPNATIEDIDLANATPDPSQVPGRITNRNTGLRPWSADNFDLSCEYYTEQGGVFSVGAFRKNIRDFFGDKVIVATEQDLQQLGMDPRYVGWQISTTYNMPGRERIDGLEFNLRQSLRPLGAWGRYFQVFANGTKLWLRGEQESDFSGFIPKSANWGFDFTRKPFALMAKWNLRGRQNLGSATAMGPDAYDYSKQRTRLDVNVDIQLRRNLNLYLSGQNVFNVPETLERYGSLTPAYARVTQVLTTGIQLTFGVKSQF